MRTLKSIGFALLVAVLFVNVSQASNGLVVKSDLTSFGLLPNPTTTFSKIFFNGIDENTLFIDFEAVNDPIASISLYRDTEVMMNDDVSDLPLNVIYEVNLDIMRSGEYTLVIETADGIKIHKDIWVE